MSLAVVENTTGLVLGVLCLTAGIIFLGGTLARYFSRSAALRSKRFSGPAVGSLALSVVMVALGGAVSWAAFRVRTIELTVASLNRNHDRHGTHYSVYDTTGNHWYVSDAVYFGVMEGDRVRCRATDPLLMESDTMLISCARVLRPDRPVREAP